jgi:tryptophan synthase beta chain
MVDMFAYEQFFAGNLRNFEVSDEEIARNIAELDKLL